MSVFDFRWFNVGDGLLMHDQLRMAIGFGSYSNQSCSAPEQVSGGPHFAGIGIGLREIVGSHQVGDGFGVDRIVFSSCFR